MVLMEYQSERHIGDILRERNIEIVGADLATRHGFTQVPNFILTKSDISVGAKLAYAMLLKYAWNNDACFPGQAKLSQDMGAAERSVRTYLEELETASCWKSNKGASERQTCTGCISPSSPDKLAGPDRQILPFLNGNQSRSRAADLATHSI